MRSVVRGSLREVGARQGATTPLAPMVLHAHSEG